MCNHKKRYQYNVALTSNPPKYPWICEMCGEKGYDLGKEDLSFKQFKDDYERNQHAHKRFVQ